MSYRIWLDAGHGGKDPGACANGLKEKDINLVATLECKRILEFHGVTVGMTRDSDVFYTLTERCKMANDFKADRFVSIHSNAGGGDGAEAIHSIFYGNGTEMAKSIVAAIKEYTPQNLRNKSTYSKANSTGKSDYYTVIKNTNMSACIVEMAFIDNKEDIEILDTEEEQKSFGKAIAYGILNHLKIAIKNESVTSKEEEFHKKEEAYFMKVYKNGSTREDVFSDINCTQKIGSLDPYETCTCIYETTNRAIVIYKINGTSNQRTGWVRWTGGIQK